MKPLLIALGNKSGVACAGSADHLIYDLSRQMPMALAVEHDGRFPWEKVIEDFRALDRAASCKTLEEYARDFEAYLAGLPVLATAAPLETNLIFFGYGREDVFPTVFDVVLGPQENGKWGFGSCARICLGHSDPATIHYFGDIRHISPLIYGQNGAVQERMSGRLVSELEAYHDRIRKAVRGKKYAKEVVSLLKEKEPEAMMATSFEEAGRSFYGDLLIGLDSFGVAELVSAAETLVDANVRLEALRSRGESVMDPVREIAVMTRAEGLTWIKHAVFAV